MYRFTKILTIVLVALLASVTVNAKTQYGFKFSSKFLAGTNRQVTPTEMINGAATADGAVTVKLLKGTADKDIGTDGTEPVMYPGNIFEIKANDPKYVITQVIIRVRSYVQFENDVLNSELSAGSMTSGKHLGYDVAIWNTNDANDVNDLTIKPICTGSTPCSAHRGLNYIVVEYEDKSIVSEPTCETPDVPGYASTSNNTYYGDNIKWNIVCHTPGAQVRYELYDYTENPNGVEVTEDSPLFDPENPRILLGKYDASKASHIWRVNFKAFKEGMTPSATQKSETFKISPSYDSLKDMLDKSGSIVRTHMASYNGELVVTAIEAAASQQSGSYARNNRIYLQDSEGTPIILGMVDPEKMGWKVGTKIKGIYGYFKYEKTSPNYKLDFMLYNVGEYTPVPSDYYTPEIISHDNPIVAKEISLDDIDKDHVPYEGTVFLVKDTRFYWSHGNDQFYHPAPKNAAHEYKRIGFHLYTPQDERDLPTDKDLDIRLVYDYRTDYEASHGYSFYYFRVMDYEELLPKMTEKAASFPAPGEDGTAVVSSNQTIYLYHPTEGTQIRYTLDGSEPTEESTLYDGPFSLPMAASTTLTFKPFHPDYRLGQSTVVKYERDETVIAPFDFEKAEDAVSPVTLNVSGRNARLSIEGENISLCRDGYLSVPQGTTLKFTSPFAVKGLRVYGYQGESTDGLLTITPRGEQDRYRTFTATASADMKIAAFQPVLDDTAELSPYSLELDKTSVEFMPGDTDNISATIDNDDKDIYELKFISSDESIVTVDGEGKLTAMAEGKTTVTASLGDKTAVCDVTVLHRPVPVTGISLDKTSVEMMEADVVTLTATCLPENADPYELVWESSDESVATVVGGVVSGVVPGKATITVSVKENPEMKAVCEVTVIHRPIPVTSITLDKNIIEMFEDETASLSATCLPENADPYELVWESSDESVATVADGVVTAKSAGSANVTVSIKDNPDMKASCQVTVKKSSGLNDIFRDSDNVNVFNLQGILIVKNATVKDIEKLNKGLYIINGKKIKL